jgi:hypothetical protein
MVHTADSLAQSLRAKTTPILGAYARIVAAHAAAERVHKLAHSAMHAFAHHSPEEATCALRALDFATDRMSDHVEHALIAIDAERAA